MPRPKKSPEEKRNKRDGGQGSAVTISITRGERTELELAARIAGRPIARVVREAALRAIRADIARSQRCCP